MRDFHLLIKSTIRDNKNRDPPVLPLSRGIEGVPFFLFDHHFPATTDIDALRNRSLHQFPAIEGEPGIIHPASSIFHQTDTHLLLAEVEVEGADGLLAGFGLACSKVAEELEVCAEGADRHRGARIVERVAGAEVELGVVAHQLQSAGEAEPGAIAEDEMHVTALHDDGLEVVRKRFLKRVQI